MLLTVEQAAEILNISVHTLANWRAQGIGPAYIKVNDSLRARVRYKREDIENYINKGRVVPTEDTKEGN